ncbi:MAG TPA: hypothetical protein VLB80_00510 [Candidatus Babeliales bacterium]|nr:hypothetical protein [Candidatus Babeliales bacterium]
MNTIYKKKFIIVVTVSYVLLYLLSPLYAHQQSDEFVTIAILAKDKAHTLPLYLTCIENQTWPAHKTYLYIRTNNNNDETATILQEWITRVGKNYAKIYFNDTDVIEPVQQFKQHEWNYMRLKVICTLRQQSIDWALRHNSHYFVADCDNFIYPDVIEAMMQTYQPIVAPLLRCSGNNSSPYYSNYHYAIDENGYYSHSPFYYTVFNQEVKGLIEVPVVHCTYFIRREFLNKLTYDDDSARYDYVIFSHSARKQNIAQYIDNRKEYGYITFAETSDDLNKELFIDTFN